MSLRRGRILCALVTATALSLAPLTVSATPAQPGLLTDPFLQLPAEGQVNVVWFTEEAGENHAVLTGDVAGLDDAQLSDAIAGDIEGVNAFDADSFQLSRMAEDHESFIDSAPAASEGIVDREVHRHEATVTGLPDNERVDYRVFSLIDGQAHLSDVFTARDALASDEGSVFMLTSDHQQKKNTVANLTYSAETILEEMGPIENVLVAGDLLNHPDRGTEWFDDNRGLGFFPGMQGNAGHVSEANGVTYDGAEVAQHAPLFPVIGNHEVQGRVDGVDSIGESFNSPVPREVAEAEYEKVAAEVNPSGDPQVRAEWIEDNSWSVTSYEEIFSLPESDEGGEQYYATSIGNTRVISLFSTRIWRDLTAEADPAAREVNSRFHDSADSMDTPLERGYGQFIFEDLGVDSEQYSWLKDELNSNATQDAEHVIVMMHESAMSMGDNVTPHFSQPVATEEKDEDGNVIGVRYEYTAEDSQLVTAVQPLIDKQGTPVDLVFNGHNHLWNRFESPNGVNYLETSNVGNSYGAFHPLSANGERPVPPEPWDASNYPTSGVPGGLEPVVPTENPFQSEIDPSQPAPYVTSNDYSVFSGFDSTTGSVKSWVFDGREAEPTITLLDEFNISDAHAPGEDTELEGNSSLTSSGSSISGVFSLIGDIGGAIAEFFRRLF